MFPRGDQNLGLSLGGWGAVVEFEAPGKTEERCNSRHCHPTTTLARHTVIPAASPAIAKHRARLCSS